MKIKIPSHFHFLWPTLRALEIVGGSARIEELVRETSKIMRLSEELMEIPHGNSNRTEFDYRCAWARTDLKAIGALENSERGVWTLTSLGRSLGTEDEVRAAVSVHRKSYKSRKQGIKNAAIFSQENNNIDQDGNEKWQLDLLDTMKAMPADAFERLCQRVLRESNFIEVEVTGKSGDGGIDGVGILKVALLSFRVVFQAKRYRETVEPSTIRDFRGGMIGRADKGLIITTGRFTQGARREAIRDGAQAIDLVDGLELCELLKSLKLGVTTELVERVSIDTQFFSSL
jgi:restriction system protein